MAVPNPLGKVGEDQNPRVRATDSLEVRGDSPGASNVGEGSLHDHRTHAENRTENRQGGRLEEQVGDGQAATSILRLWHVGRRNCHVSSNDSAKDGRFWSWVAVAGNVKITRTSE